MQAYQSHNAHIPEYNADRPIVQCRHTSRTMLIARIMIPTVSIGKTATTFFIPAADVFRILDQTSVRHVTKIAHRSLECSSTRWRNSWSDSN